MTRPIAFVIMPFAPEFDAVFREILQPALADYEVARADTRLDERNILAKIMTGIDEADLVVADVTETNPNVLYELGVAHALGKPTIMITETLERLPFDIRSYPVHEYGRARERASRLSSLLRDTATQHRAGGVLFGNPVADFVTRVGRLGSEPIQSAAYTPEMCVDDMNWVAEHTGTFFQRLHDISAEHIARLAEATTRIGRRGTTTPMSDAGVRKAADTTRDFARELDALSSEFHETWERFGCALRWLLSPEVRPHLGDAGVKQYVQRARDSDENLNALLANLAELRHVQNSFPDYAGGNLTHALEVSRASISNLLNEIMTAKMHLAWVMRH